MRKSAPLRFGRIGAKPPLAFRGQRIGLLGGSFNPPHFGHRQVSQVAMRRLGLTQIWWIVTPGNPLKSRHELLPLPERLALCQRVADDRRIRITAFEQDLDATFTAGTLAFLLKRRREARFVWLMGADCLAEFHRWQHWRDIFAMLPIAVIDRPGHHLRALAAPAAHAFGKVRLPEQCARLLGSRATGPAWTCVTGRLSPLSSTEIRAGWKR